MVTRTMSKAFALAGGRLGYLAASREVVNALRIVRLPYHLSAITQAAARAALAHHRELQAQVDEIRAERDDTVDWLRAQGYTVPDTDANFALFGPVTDRDAVFEGLLERGVLIRVVGPEGWLRVSIGTAREMAMFRNGLAGGHRMSNTHEARAARVASSAPRASRACSSNSTSTAPG